MERTPLHCCRCLATASERTEKKTPPLPRIGSSKEKATPLLCHCPATGALIQFFQRYKWSRNEQNHVGECGDDSFTVRSRQTHRETGKQIYIRSTNGHRPSSNFSKNVSPHGSSEPIERKTKTFAKQTNTYVRTTPTNKHTFAFIYIYIYDYEKRCQYAILLLGRK
jgi:hypothetical protein